jgi:hypothetical protein
MKQRRRAIAGMSALTTSFVGWIATGCLEVDPIIEDKRGGGGFADGGVADGAKRCLLPRPEPDLPSCEEKGATFQPKSIPPAFPATRACTLAQIQALGGACKIAITSDPTTDPECVNARAANSTCADCIFGNKDDEREKIATLLPGEKPAMRVNVSACIDHHTGVSGCGGQFINVAECFDTFCTLVDDGGLCSSDAQVSECVKRVRDGDCKPFLIEDQTCGEGIQNAKECFPANASAASMRDFFEAAANIACGEKAVVNPLKDGGS